MLGDLFKGKLDLGNRNSGNPECPMSNSCFMATNCIQNPSSCTFLKSLSGENLDTTSYAPRTDYGSGILESKVREYPSSVIGYLNLKEIGSTPGDYSGSSSGNLYNLPNPVGDLEYKNGGTDKYTDLSQAA